MISILGAIIFALLSTTSCITAEPIEKAPWINEERDTHAVDTITNFGLTLKCLVDLVGTADTINDIYIILDKSIERAHKLSKDIIANLSYMDIVNQETSLTLADIRSIHPLCSNIALYCQHHTDFVQLNTVPKELTDLQTYLSMTGPLVKCLLRSCKEDVVERVYKIFENSVVGIRGDKEADITSVGGVLLQSKTIALELLKLDDNCNDVALTYDHCAHMWHGVAT